MTEPRTTTGREGGAATPLADPVLVIGAGPAGLTAAYELVGQGDPVVVVEAGHRGRRDQPHRGAGRLAVRHRRPPVLHQGQAGRGVLARDPPAGGLPPPAAHEPDLLRRQVLRLPDQARQRPVQPGGGGGRSAAACRSCGSGSVRRRTSPRSRATSSPTTAGGSTTTSSRPTTRSCGRCRPPRSRPTGVPSGSRACPCGTRSGSRSGRRWPASAETSPSR